MRWIATACALMCTTLVQGRDLHVPGDAPTVQAAIDAATGGDRVIVGPGLWAGTIDLGGKSITVASAEGPERTVLDAGGRGPGLRLVSGEGPRTIVRGFRITGGIGDATIYDSKSRVGGAVVIVGGAPVLENCIISGNLSSYRGGGIYASQSSFTMRNCVVRGNASEKGGGLYMFGGTPVIEGGSISVNNARYGGAGIFIDRSKVDCSGVLFESNIAHFSGGAVAVIDARPFIHDCRFLNNQTGISGGAIHLGWGASLREEGNVYVQQGDNVIGGSSGRLRAAKGACCFGDLCIEVLEVACVEAGGRWEGPETDCVSILAARCEAVRPGDLDRNDQVDIRDLGRLLHVWGDLNAPQQGGEDGEGR